MALTSTRWRFLATLNWRVHFDDTTRAPEWFSRIHLAWFTSSNMTEIITQMLTAFKLLITSFQTHVVTIWIRTSFWSWTAYVFTLVLLTRFHDIANSLTSMAFIEFLLLWCQQLFPELLRVIDCMTRNHSICLFANARLGNLLFTSLTGSIVTSHFTLMLSTGKESVAWISADWDWVSASLPWSTNQRLDCVTSTWTIPHPLWLEWARLAGSLMTSLLASMLTAI